MEIKCFASSSAGNCYLVRNSTTNILIEAGIPIKRITSALIREMLLLSHVAVVAITHQHGDHCQAAASLSMFIHIFASKETLAAVEKRYNGKPRIEAVPWQAYHFGTFGITAFPVDHDCEGAMGFIIYDTENDERMLFVNDTKMLRWNFKDYRFDYVMIECNHNTDLLDRNDPEVCRKASSHMSLEATKEALWSMTLTDTKAIYLMHLSDGHSDQAKMIHEAKAATGVPVYACMKDGGFAE